MSVVILGEAGGYKQASGWAPYRMLESAAYITTVGREVFFITTPLTNTFPQETSVYASSHHIDMTYSDIEHISTLTTETFIAAVTNLIIESLYHPRTVVFGGKTCHNPLLTPQLAKKLRDIRQYSTLVYVPAMEEYSLLDNANSTPPDNMRKHSESLVEISDIVIATSEDIRMLYGFDAAERNFTNISDYWLGLGASLIFFLLADGSTLVFTKAGESLRLPSLDEDETHGTDTNTPAFLTACIDGLDRVSLLGGKARESLENISTSNVFSVSSLATATRSLMNKTPGRKRPITRIEMMDAFLEYQSYNNIL
ncbi:hypothetical protein R6G85_05370 [Actinotignum urinale]|uniref:hypothetical protein n=1 Tax=Actinotignum urinale TaxID=190146 RepID=UPI0003B4F412|nr:hypothetical protein [Actinotignum urinale]MDY5128648.1 hypothetical protein [Actinotignum urinale]MDY5151910.1 hypothetical protein [Actinotignum urinale]MDY5159729.1 hypothetical protein [Actinotignum urinale]